LNLSIVAYFATSISPLDTFSNRLRRLHSVQAKKLKAMQNLRNTLFVPHGAPTFALHPGAAGAAMAQVASFLKTPRAIIVVSPHWETAYPTVGTGAHLETIHDFYGFPSALYDIKYPATGCPEGAQVVINALKAHFPRVEADPARGLDHGAWIPLLQMFPDADVPVIPLSVQSHAGPEHAYAVGQALAGQSPAYVQVFADWVAQHMAEGEVDALLNYRHALPEGRRAHPTEEHLLPLFVALGAAGQDATPSPFYRGISDHVLAMDGYAFVERN
jgi:4,5-DOPA dioxygenase extradiol